MKDKALTLIIGILIGAIITSGGFLLYNLMNKKNYPLSQGNNHSPQFSNGEMPSNGPKEKNNSSENGKKQFKNSSGNMNSKKNQMQNGEKCY